MSSLRILFFFLLMSQIQFAQWTNLNPVPDGNDLWSTFFIDDSTGWIVGTGGFLKKTTNAGNEWIQQNSGTTLTLKSIQFINNNTGWICGESGLILKTTNSGTTWDSLASGTTQHLSDIYFFDVDTGYVVGFGGTILKTTNGGAYWTSLNSGTSNDLYSMDFVDAFTGYAVGEINDTSSVIKTTDGGASWIDKSSGFPATSGNCLALEFIDFSIGFIGCGHNLYKTIDGGDSWSLSEASFPFKHEETENREQLSPYPINEQIHSIYFKDANNGWYLDWHFVDNYIYCTTDGGISWESERHVWERPLLSLFFTPNGTGLSVGSMGLMYSKVESDSGWTRLLSGTRDYIYSVHFVNENIGWAGGTRWGNPYKSIVLKTTNGGKEWKTQFEQVTYGYSRCFYFMNDLLGWLASSHNATTELVGGGIYRTTDGGENWIAVHSTGDYSSVFFINKDTGWVTSDYSNSTGIYKTIDGGFTLVKKSSASTSSIYFTDINTGWAVGTSGILKSTDGGETWISKSNLSASHVKFYNSNIGMCEGGSSVLVSIDGGETWNSKSGPLLQTINFINSKTIWGYTSDGNLYKTTNLGDTWESLNIGLGFGKTAFFINENTGWVGGFNGTMFKYSVEPPPPPTPPVWTNQILVEDADGIESAQYLTFGQHINATDSIDALLGEYEIPPAPPTSIFDSRFNLPTNPQVSSFIDYRDSTKTDIIWNMSFQPGSGGYPITFSWDSTGFPEGTFYLQDVINGSLVNINMKNLSSYTLLNQAINTLNISYKGLCNTIPVNNDWNIVSVPLLADDMSLNNLFPSATSLAYSYSGEYISEDTLVTGTGYWLKFDGNEQIQICGLTQDDTVSLQQGWNMVGVFENNIPINQITTTPPGIIATYFFEYNDGYYIADTLKSGQGYWVRVTSDGVLNLNVDSFVKEEEQQPIVIIDPDWGKIEIINNDGNSVTLYATNKKTDLSQFELPPVPPIGIFDARYSSGNMIEDISSKRIIRISPTNYPVTIRAKGLNIMIKDMINGNLVNEELNNGEEIKITNNKITSIEISGMIAKGFPVNFELYQNFPNPFNPTTTIRFALPSESVVNLSIYNVLGELIRTLINGSMKPGYHEFELNASLLSSGVYIYRIQAENFVQSKKMVIIK